MTAPLDIAIVGGGITGAGIARDAALRGLRVGLFDKGDFGAGTSSKSSKLVHGGLRYLEQGEVGLVFESVSERRVQMRVAPHLVRPLAFLLPIYRGDRVGLERMNLGLWIYDLLALFRSPGLHRTYRGRRRGAALEPLLDSRRLRGVMEYYDCKTDDSRLVLENVLSARAAGADCRSYTEVVGVERRRGQVACIRVRDVLTGAASRIAAHAVIVAGGPWTDRIADQLELPRETPRLRPTKGVHLVFPADRLPVRRTITMLSPIDGRVMFVIPHHGRLVVGTTDTDFTGSPDDVHADRADAEYLCRSLERRFPGVHLEPEDAISSWAGLRPLIHQSASHASDVSREHELWIHDDGILMIAGGKLTTYRLMAAEAVAAALDWLRDHKSDLFADRTLARSRTGERPLPGGDGLAAPTLAAVHAIGDGLVASHGLAPELARHLAEVYGARAPRVAALAVAEPALGRRLVPDLPYLWAEIPFAVTDDLARTIDDVLGRRVPLLLFDREQGLGVVDEVAGRMAGLLGWTDATRREQLARYRAEVAASQRFRTSAPP